MSFWEAGGLGIFNMVRMSICKVLHTRLGEQAQGFNRHFLSSSNVYTLSIDR